MLNDGKVDAVGTVWAGSTTPPCHPGAGSLLRLDRAGGAVTASLEPVVGGLTLANGLDWSPDGRLLYHADSLTGIVHRHRLADDDERSSPATSCSWSIPPTECPMASRSTPTATCVAGRLGCRRVLATAPTAR